MNFVPLSSACEIVMGQAPPGDTYNDDRIGLPLIAGASDFGDLNPKPSRFTSRAAKVSRFGDIIICVRATIGDMNWSDGEYCLGRGVAALRVRSDLADARYIWRAVEINSEKLSALGRGATFKQVAKSDIGGLEIPLPPLNEQRRIAKVLDKADDVRRKRRVTLAKLDILGQAIYAEMFGDPITNPKEWPRRTINEIGKVITGNTPPRENPDYYGSDIEWIKSDNINTPHYYLTKAKEGLSTAGKAVGRTVPPGSILITCIAGTPECIGNAALANREVAFNQQINAFIPQEGDAHFFYAQLVVGKKLIQKASTGGMKGLVSKSRFEAVSLVFPPVSLQKEFARRILAVEALKSAHCSSLLQLDALFVSVQHRAFSGELTAGRAASALEMAG